MAAANARPLVNAALIGGNGNLGRVMQHTLLDSGLGVRVVDVAQHCGTAGGRAEAEHSLPGTADSRWQTPRNVEFVRHDLGNDTVASLTDAVRGSDVVFSMVTPDVQNAPASAFRKVNETGVSGLIEACRAAGVGRLVYVSSIAATDHLTPSVGADEGTPLPPLEEYSLPYDASKRRAEETVLAADGTDGMRTCALRVGGILASPTDYTCRDLFKTPGRIISVDSEQIDYIGAPDFSRALIRAAECLGDEPAKTASGDGIGGTATFVTKCRAGKAPKVHEIAGAAATMLGWDFTLLPRGVLHAVRFGAATKYGLQKLTAKTEDELPGAPPHKYMGIPLVEKTFNNTRAREVLGFRPRETWEEALEHIIQQYRDTAK